MTRMEIVAKLSDRPALLFHYRLMVWLSKIYLVIGLVASLYFDLALFLLAASVGGSVKWFSVVFMIAFFVVLIALPLYLIAGIKQLKKWVLILLWLYLAYQLGALLFSLFSGGLINSMTQIGKYWSGGTLSKAGVAYSLIGLPVTIYIVVVFNYLYKRVKS